MSVFAPAKFSAEDPVWTLLRDNWATPLDRFSLPLDCIGVSRDDAIAIGSVDPQFRSRFDLDVPLPLSEQFWSDVKDSLNTFPDGMFVKLGLFSFKASDRPAHATRIGALNDLQAMLRDPPQRMVRALGHMLAADLAVTLFATPWQSIPPWCEFRMFFDGGELVGISQYHYTQRYAEIVENLRTIEATLTTFAASLLPYLPQPDCVADVALSPDPNGSAWLIEFNPLWPETDRCLFARSVGDGFDRTFRYAR